MRDWSGSKGAIAASQGSSAALVLKFLPYRRRFEPPLKTAHGLWVEREGLVVQLRRADGTCGYGEIAPLPWFGTETLAAAIALLRELPLLNDSIAVETLIPEEFPATRFGLGLALAQLRGALPDAQAWADLDCPASLCALLPPGQAALRAWQPLYRQGHRTFKWKLGLAALDRELAELTFLRRSLPPDAQLRLDANGSLSLTEAELCLAHCDALAAQASAIEFLEQPLAPQRWAETLDLSRRYQTPLALDEAVATLPQLQHVCDQGWRGIVVIKGAIAGDPLAVVSFCHRQQLDVVWSSVFETAIGRRGVLAMAAALGALDRAVAPGAANSHCPMPRRALGLGVGQWLADGLGEAVGATAIGDEALWQRLSN